MKKVIALVLATLLVIIPLAGCNGVGELRQEIENLEKELSQVKEQISEIESNISNVELSEPPSETSKNETQEIEPSDSTSDMSDYLSVQLQSNKYADWDAVASCDYATEKHLLTVAKQCATISTSSYSSINSDHRSWAKAIATSICENPAATGKVIKELSNSPWYAVWNIAAQSAYADEEALISIAKKCATISTSSYSSINSDHRSWAKAIATSICENPATTGKVIKELSNSPWYAVWNIASQSTHADEEALISIAKKCAGIPTSSYSSINSDHRSWAETIATSICENPAVTSNVLKELASANFTAVTTIAHAKLEEMCNDD